MAIRTDLKELKKFKEYRDRGLSYREIQKITGKDLRTLNRYHQYILAGYLSRQLSTAQ